MNIFIKKMKIIHSKKIFIQVKNGLSPRATPTGVPFVICHQISENVILCANRNFLLKYRMAATPFANVWMLQCSYKSYNVSNKQRHQHKETMIIICIVPTSLDILVDFMMISFTSSMS